MIYICWNCGWRINERNQDVLENRQEIGKINCMYLHHPFCSEKCVEQYKYIFKKSGDKNDASPADWNEQGWYIQGIYSNWKIERKINRPKRQKRKMHKHQTFHAPTSCV